MAKVRTAFFCQNCGAQSAKWVGKCPSCGEWNTYVEEVIEKVNAFQPGGKVGFEGELFLTEDLSLPEKPVSVHPYRFRPTFCWDLAHGRFGKEVDDSDA